MARSETRSAAPAFAAFLSTAASYWLGLLAVLWFPLHLMGGGLGPLRVIGGLLMPGALLLLGFRQRGNSPAIHAFLVALAFSFALTVSVARHALLPAPVLPDESARALIRMMTYAFAGAALHAAILNALVAFRASPAHRG